MRGTWQSSRFHHRCRYRRREEKTEQRGSILLGVRYSYCYKTLVCKFTFNEKYFVQTSETVRHSPWYRNNCLTCNKNSHRICSYESYNYFSATSVLPHILYIFWKMLLFLIKNTFNEFDCILMGSESSFGLDPDSDLESEGSQLNLDLGKSQWLWLQSCTCLNYIAKNQPTHLPRESISV